MARFFVSQATVYLQEVGFGNQLDDVLRRLCLEGRCFSAHANAEKYYVSGCHVHPRPRGTRF